MKYLFAFLSLMASPLYALCETQVSLHSGANWAGFDVEVAATPQTRALGLMNRESLAPDAGMLFLYPESLIRQFWMKDTKIPLDILFFDDAKRLINVHKNTMPFSEAIIPSEAASAIVLEVNAGIFDLFDMDEERTKLRIQPITSESCPPWVREKFAKDS